MSSCVPAACSDGPGAAKEAGRLLGLCKIHWDHARRVSGVAGCLARPCCNIKGPNISCMVCCGMGGKVSPCFGRTTGEFYYLTRSGDEPSMDESRPVLRA